MIKILMLNPFYFAASMPALRAVLIALIPSMDLVETLKLAIVLITGLLNLLLNSYTRLCFIF